MKTLISLIIDRSGSMAGKEKDVIGGVNNFLAEQKKVEGEALVTVLKFSDRVTTLCRLTPVSDVRPLDYYTPSGNTALLDAVGYEIVELDKAWSRHYPDRTIVVVVTDGEENASKSYSKLEIMNRIQDRERSGKWNFVYLGASAAAFHEAKTMGFDWQNTAQYRDTARGTQSAYFAASASVSALRGGALNAGLGSIIPEDLG